MSDDFNAPEGGEGEDSPITVITPAADAPEAFNSPSDAARALVQARSKPAESANPATAEPELSDEDNADPEEVPSEDTSDAEPEALPPIERPRSWTKDVDDDWKALPRTVQEKIASREQEREIAIRRSQNEAAEIRKGIEAERTKAEQLRQQYEANLPALMQTLQDAQQSAFADVRTVDDVTKLANEDPFRYLQWQAHQTKLQAVNAEVERAKGQKSQAEQAEWTKHVQKENELAIEYIPELADKVKGPALTQRAADRLSELGFKQEELAKLASGQEKLSLYDHRIQRLIFSDLKLSDIQAAKTAVAAKPVPPVQRPGIARPAGSGKSEEIQALTEQLNKTGDLRIAQQLRALQVSQRRAS